MHGGKIIAHRGMDAGGHLLSSNREAQVWSDNSARTFIESVGLPGRGVMVWSWDR